MTLTGEGRQASASVVIPTHGRSELLQRTLESLSRVRWPERFIDVCVVENGEPGGAREIVDRFRDTLPLIYKHISSPGLGLARNAGMAEVAGEMVLFLDNDLRLESDTLLAYRDAFDRYGRSCFYGGPVLPDYVAEPEPWLRAFLPPSAGGFYLGDEDRRIDKPAFIGASTAFPCRLLEEHGGFDTICATGSGGGVGEETRLQKRLLAEGFQGIYVARARVWHYVPPERCSPQWVLDRAYRHGLTAGLISRPAPRMLGVPRWSLRRGVGVLGRLWFQRLTRQPLARRFSAEWDWAELKGIVAGYRQREAVSRRNAPIENTEGV